MCLRTRADVPGKREHGTGDIDCDHAPAGSDGAGEFDGGGAAAATDVDHRRSGARGGEFEQRRCNGGERAVETILMSGPVFAVGSIQRARWSWLNVCADVMGDVPILKPGIE